MSQPLALPLAPCGQSTDTRLTMDSVYAEYYPPIQTYLHRLCGSREQAEDLAQETFARAWSRWRSFRGECSVATWLYRIARNAYLNSRRAPTPTRIDTDELLALPDHAALGDPVREYAASEQRDDIVWALAQLPEKHRSILLLRDAQDLSYAEIAEVLDISLAAVKVNLFRARVAFRQVYGHVATEADDE